MKLASSAKTMGSSTLFSLDCAGRKNRSGAQFDRLHNYGSRRVKIERLDQQNPANLKHDL
jgi:hypothetical protein